MTNIKSFSVIDHKTRDFFAKVRDISNRDKIVTVDIDDIFSEFPFFAIDLPDKFSDWIDQHEILKDYDFRLLENPYINGSFDHLNLSDTTFGHIVFLFKTPEAAMFFKLAYDPNQIKIS